MNVKETYTNEVKARLKGLDAQIEHMAQRVDDASADAQAEYRDRLTSLKRQRDKVQKQFAQLQESSDAAWNDLRQGFDDALSVFTDAVNDARAHFKNEEIANEKAPMA